MVISQNYSTSLLLAFVLLGVELQECLMNFNKLVIGRIKAQFACLCVCVLFRSVEINTRMIVFLN